MTASELAALIEEFEYILAKISKHLKNNQYVYLRVFDSWAEGYNSIATRLNDDGTIRVPLFKLSPIDYSTSGKSIKEECIKRFVKTITCQVSRLEDKINELNSVDDKRLSTSSLERFFPGKNDTQPLERAMVEEHVMVVLPAEKSERKINHDVIKSALDTFSLPASLNNHAELDDDSLSQMCRDLHHSRLVIIDISGHSANAMLALGLAYGSGKPVVILQPESETEFGKAYSLGHLKYSQDTDIRAALEAILSELLSLQSAT